VRILSRAARLQKLRAMTPTEVVERLRYRAVLAIERDAHRRGTLAPPDRLERALRPELRGDGWQQRLLEARRASRSTFFWPQGQGDAVRRLFTTRYDAERLAASAKATLAREHRFEFFGREFTFGPDVDWQSDPVSGRGWPRTFHADVPVHRGDVGYGDVKYVWELSRQQYLIDLGKSFFLDRDRTNLDAIERLVRSWMTQNPYATGVNWSCALEPAFRAWSWLWAYHLTADSLDADFHVEWLRGFYDHGRFLARHLEHYSSPYNHLVGEAAALYALGVLFPEFRASGSWRRLGKRVLHHTLHRQFYPDGGSVEQSTFYHHATTGFYLLAALIGRANGDEFEPPVWQAIERALDFSMHLTQPDGRTPSIGGADDGKPIRMEHLPFWDFRPYLAIGAVLFRRGEWKAIAGRFYEDALWLLGPDGVDAFDALTTTTPAATSVLLGASGYAVHRSDWSPAADYVCFDVGEQAAGMRSDGVPNSMHGHADCLSVILSIGGRPVLADGGLFAYNCGGAWEDHFRETAAHSTARVDGRDQARHIGKMAWSYSYQPSIEGSYDDRKQAWTLASHDGFNRGPEGVTHRRAVWRRSGYFVICDEFTGRGRHQLEVNWQFAPGRIEPIGPTDAVFAEIARMTWTGSGDWTSEIRCAGPGPGDGWICSSLGVRRPAPRLTLRTTMTASPTRLLTVIADVARNEIQCDADAALISVVQPEGTDLIAVSGLTGRAVATDALVAICRIRRDGNVEQFRIGGSYVRLDPNLFRSRQEELLSVPS
jgi:hypothetical protein